MKKSVDDRGRHPTRRLRRLVRLPAMLAAVLLTSLAFGWLDFGLPLTAVASVIVGATVSYALDDDDRLA